MSRCNRSSPHQSLCSKLKLSRSCYTLKSSLTNNTLDRVSQALRFRDPSTSGDLTLCTAARSCVYNMKLHWYLNIEIDWVVACKGHVHAISRPKWSILILSVSVHEQAFPKPTRAGVALRFTPYSSNLPTVVFSASLGFPFLSGCSIVPYSITTPESCSSPLFGSIHILIMIFGPSTTWVPKVCLQHVRQLWANST